MTKSGVAKSWQGPAPPVSARRKKYALAVAGAADLLQAFFFPLFIEGAGSVFDLAVDAVVAVVLLLILGFHPRLLIALAAELTPFAALFPSWTAVVLTLKTSSPPPPPPG